VHTQIYVIADYFNLQPVKEVKESKDDYIHKLQQKNFTLTSQLETTKKEIEFFREELFKAEKKVYYRY